LSLTTRKVSVINIIVIVNVYQASVFLYFAELFTHIFSNSLKNQMRNILLSIFIDKTEIYNVLVNYLILISW
jgi:branched-subunit amino acid transport protein AzlD